ncbi:MAG: peptidoglycan editing factor PgeF [Alphaproteobacteria bacterium]|nr:peptidoglycan editing factor PgeF [Alphaproteobacteria bacterium]
MNIYICEKFPSARVSHGFFGRQGGVSEGIYESLNCGQGSGDDPAHVEENRARVAAKLGVGRARLLSLYQIHSDVCLRVTEGWEERPEADAHVTDRPGLALSILTADCAPVLFYGEKDDGAPVIGAAHAGWRGAFGGVLESTVGAMKDLGAKPASIRAAIGPCIAKASYEVDDGFVQRFIETDEANEHFFGAAARAGHAMFDLAGYAAARLARAGVKNVSILDLDTCADEAAFFSYRRKTHRNEPDYGRQISAIVINS